MKTLKLRDKMKDLVTSNPSLLRTAVPAIPAPTSVAPGVTEQPEVPSRSELNYLRERVSFFSDILRTLLIRTPDEADEEVSTICSKLSSIPPVMLKTYIEENYNHAFYLAEPDIEFKKKLAQGIQEVISQRLPSYTNYAVQDILTIPEYDNPLLKSFIES